MQGQWVIWLLIADVVYAAANSCDSDYAADCYSDLVHYDSLAFPLYGEDEYKLDEICHVISTSFDCINSYAEFCHNSSECGDECHKLVQDIHQFSGTTGLRSLTEELCSRDSAVRAIYLENYHCLESNADVYAFCHNESQISLEYLNTLTDPDSIIVSRCCFFTWYHDCFTNVTRDHCGQNATFFVSFAMHKLVSHIADQLCLSTNLSCGQPPMPQDDEELDKEKPDQTDNEIDNSIHNMPKAAATIRSYGISVMMLAYCFTVLSKCIL